MTIIVNGPNGWPSITASQDNYIQVVEELGFTRAHRQMLEEFKAALSADERYGSQPGEVAKQADLWEGGLYFAAQSARPDLIHMPIKRRDALFHEVFGEAGRLVTISAEKAIQDEVNAFMRETGITDEGEARRLMMAEMVEGMGFIADNLEQITRSADLMEQVEDAIGPVDWRDMPDEQ